MSSFETPKNYKQYLDVSYADFIPRFGIWCRPPRIYSLIKKPNPLPNKNSTACYFKRSTLNSSSFYNHLQRRQWTFIPNYNMNCIPLAPSVHPQVRRISGQSGEETLGAWKHVFLWLSESTPVGYTQEFLLFMHNSTGLPWWTTVIVATVFLRTVVTFPLAVYQVCSMDKSVTK
jgi:membrane protein insertase Oxa1/YidC/SpoIIIJ